MRVLCLVDNTAKGFSTFWAEHGLSFLIDSPEGKVLFDTGASGHVLLHNMEEAGISPESLFALVLSHAHWDHTGGVPAILERHPGIPLYANPDIFRERFALRDGGMKPIGLPISPEEITKKVDLRLSPHPQEVLPGIWTTGEIFPRTAPEGRSPHHFMGGPDGVVPDPYSDDMAVVLETGHGLVLLCGCCHAGLLNTLTHVRRTFGRDPIAIVGGLHLATADELYLSHLIERLREIGSPLLRPNHCTGQNAYLFLAMAFGDRISQCPAGTIMDF